MAAKQACENELDISKTTTKSPNLALQKVVKSFQGLCIKFTSYTKALVPHGYEMVYSWAFTNHNLFLLIANDGLFVYSTKL